VTRAAGRAAAAGFLGALSGLVWLALFYGTHPVLRLDMDRDPPRLVSGLYPVERDDASRLTFAWTTDRVTIRLPGIDRHVPWTLRVRARSARPTAGEQPELDIAADGIQVSANPASHDFEDVTAELPARPDRRGLTIVLSVSKTFVPGPADTRALGLMLDRIELSPGGIVLPPRTAYGGSASASAAIGAAIAFLGVTAGSAIGGAVAAAAAIAYVISRGFGPYTSFPATAAQVSIVVSLVLVICTGVLRAGRGQELRNTARFAVAATGCALIVKLLVLLHPEMPIGDALFHAHRFQDVLAGNLFFTSTAPGGYLFPYAPGLYVFGWVWSGLVRRGSADMTLLRAIVTSADALAGVCLYPIIARPRGDRLGGACAVALFHLIPIAFGVIAIGNLTNAFAQSLSVGALAMMCVPSLRADSPVRLALFAGVLTAAFLSHTSTFALLAAATLATAVLFRWRGGPVLKSPAVAIAISLGAAVVLAVGLYYAWFLETYRSELSRIASETAAAAPDAGGRGISGRAASVPGYVFAYFGVAIVILACAGAVVLWRRALADRLTLTLAGWALACAAFLAIGVLTPVDMRYYLAAVPALAAAAGIGASYAWSSGPRARAAAIVLLGWAFVNGVHSWFVNLP
jgi:hypothetical protein